MRSYRIHRVGVWLFIAVASLYGLLYGLLGAFFPAVGDAQIARLAGLPLARFQVDPLHGIWIREVITVSITRLFVAVLALLAVWSSLTSGRRWALLASLVFGLLLLRGVQSELEEGVTFILFTGCALAALWLVSFILCLWPKPR